MNYGLITTLVSAFYYHLHSLENREFIIAYYPNTNESKRISGFHDSDFKKFIKGVETQPMISYTMRRALSNPKYFKRDFHREFWVEGVDFYPLFERYIFYPGF